MHRIVSIITILLVLFSASYSYAAINYDQKISVYDSAKSQILRNMAENSSYSILENRHYQTISRVSNDNNRNRYYSPALGRFTSKDPIGFAADVNLYRYADGNPVIYIDPFGFVS
ncbi:MAG: RHS repeat-associated core domain-containing protein, partial [Candidatus Riflebacteria bacterium]|nr:RHS repeat-associated core domain-containing protein [Candidatus Riflebacteria bacterium]